MKPTLIKAMMMPKDTNPHGFIFGGTILSYMDQAGAIKAREHVSSVARESKKVSMDIVSNLKFVTVAMDSVEFLLPVFVGDIINVSGEVVETGKSSVTIKIVVTADRFSDLTKSVKVTESTITYVAVNDSRQPVPIFDILSH